MNKTSDNDKIEFLDLTELDAKSSEILEEKNSELIVDEQEKKLEENAKENTEEISDLNTEEKLEFISDNSLLLNTEDDLENRNAYENLEFIPKESAELDSEDEIEQDLVKMKSKKNKIITYVRRTAITLLFTIVILLAGIYSLMCMLVYGPSPTAKDLFVMSVKETSAMGFLANWFFTDAQIKDIMDKNSIKDTNEVTDTSLVSVNITNNNSETKSETPEIEIVDIKGPTYRGKLMIVKDPSRVFVGTVPTFMEGDGLVVSEIAKNHNAIGGINGGEFVDGGSTYTAMPIGLVMTNGNIVNGDKTKVCHVTGFTKDNILVVGNMTGQQALDMKMRDCVSISNHIGPFLIINGATQDVEGIGGGTNPRTAIGQRADGAVLLLVIDGRQVNTVGATFGDLMYSMQQYGAVNASAMDGGTSTQMYYEGNVINAPYSPTGPRRCPTSFLVGGAK